MKTGSRRGRADTATCHLQPHRGNTIQATAPSNMLPKAKNSSNRIRTRALDLVGKNSLSRVNATCAPPIPMPCSRVRHVIWLIHGKGTHYAQLGCDEKWVRWCHSAAKTRNHREERDRHERFAPSKCVCSSAPGVCTDCLAHENSLRTVRAERWRPEYGRTVVIDACCGWLRSHSHAITGLTNDSSTSSIASAICWFVK